MIILYILIILDIVVAECINTWIDYLIICFSTDDEDQYAITDSISRELYRLPRWASSDTYPTFHNSSDMFSAHTATKPLTDTSRTHARMHERTRTNKKPKNVCIITRKVK